MAFTFGVDLPFRNNIVGVWYTKDRRFVAAENLSQYPRECRYSTHQIYSNGSCAHGHYDMSFEDALDDLLDRSIISGIAT